MFFQLDEQFRKFLQEEGGDDGFGQDAGGDGFDEPGGEPGGEQEKDGGEEEISPSPWLRDLTEEDGYSILSQAREFPGQMRGLESRVYGRFGPLNERLQNLEKSLKTRTSFDESKIGEITKALDDYDSTGTLSNAIKQLTEGLQVGSIDDATLAPHLGPMQERFSQQMGEEIVKAFYDPEQLAEIVPEVQNGQWAPQSQKHKDFIDWLSQQGYDTHQALQNFGSPYVRALQRFEAWEQEQVQKRTKAEEAKGKRLAGGKQPSSQGVRGKTAGPQTVEEAWLAGFNEVD